ncbi:MAG: HD domain-containing protein [Lachnospiraceae bacterium]|nr:HD domain-containing protein [Lachnospiraceae bacterium]
MGKIVDYNLTEEISHGIYVSRLARDVTRALGHDEEMQYDMALAGMLHDIGKLRLTNYIYGEATAESPLMIEEMKYVRMHSLLSYNIVKSRGYNARVCETILYHHENMDGSGYPENLSGEDIPEGSRIIRVCDVFAALTTDRPYRKSFTKDEALSLMIDEINNFDMRVFLAFEHVVHKVATSYQPSLPDLDNMLLEGLTGVDRILREKRLGSDTENR